MAKQNYRCAGCGIRIDPGTKHTCVVQIQLDFLDSVGSCWWFLCVIDYIKRLRYCEYLGRYFCQCCHENAQAVIPGKIIRKWDFSKSYVSNFSRDLLAKIAGDPLFNLNDINSSLYKKVKALETVRVRYTQSHDRNSGLFLNTNICSSLRIDTSI